MEINMLQQLSIAKGKGNSIFLFLVIIACSGASFAFYTPKEGPKHNKVSTADMTACDNGVIFVDASATNGGDGIAWGTAYNKLQDALSEACNCANPVEVWVAQGTYYPDEGIGQVDNDLESTFELCNNVGLYGGFSGTGTEILRSERDVENNETILSGDLEQNDLPFNPDLDSDSDPGTFSQIDHLVGLNAYNVLVTAGTDNTAVVDGFTITAGNADKFTSLNRSALGGGIHNDDGSPTLNNLILKGNFARFGGAISSLGRPSDLRLTNSDVIANACITTGGGIIHSGNSISLLNCFFEKNRGISGGAFRSANELLVDNCIFKANEGGIGGAIYHDSPSSNANSEIKNTSIIGNTSTGFGGGIYLEEVNISIINTLIAGNETGNNGGGIYYVGGGNFSRGPVITNSTITGNKAAAVGGGINMASRFVLTINNTIIWNNEAASKSDDLEESINLSTSNITGIANSIIEHSGGSGVNWETDLGTDNGGNLDTDPQFIDPIDLNSVPTCEGNLSILPSSPAINMGDNAADLDGSRNQTATISSITEDLAGNERIQETTIDIGAYEQRTCASIPILVTASDQTAVGSTLTLDGNDPAIGLGQWSILSGDGLAFFGDTPGTLTASEPNAIFNGTVGEVYTLEWKISVLGTCENSIQITVTLEDPAELPVFDSLWSKFALGVLLLSVMVFFMIRLKQ